MDPHKNWSDEAQGLAYLAGAAVCAYAMYRLIDLWIWLES
jgi:hypothetical protein